METINVFEAKPKSIVLVWKTPSL